METRESVDARAVRLVVCCFKIGKVLLWEWEVMSS